MNGAAIGGMEIYMNKTEKNKKLFSSGGIFVDFFIGFLIAACIAGVVYRCFIYDPSARVQEGETYEVYFEIENARESFADYLNHGDAVYDSATGMQIGVLTLHQEHAENSAVALVQDAQNENAPVVIRGVMSSVTGDMEQGTLVIDGMYSLTPGQVLEIYTDTVSVNIRILQITECSEEK